MARTLSKKPDQFLLRLPEGMRETIVERAEQNGRTLTAEIVWAIETSNGKDVPSPEASRGLYEDQFHHLHREVENQLGQCRRDVNSQVAAVQGEIADQRRELAVRFDEIVRLLLKVDEHVQSIAQRAVEDREGK